MILASIIISICVLLILYHHVVYVLFIRAKTKSLGNKTKPKPLNRDNAPTIGVFIAAHNEEEFIHNKLLNLAIQDYPQDKITIHLLLDGCTDNTKAQALIAIKQLQQEHILCHLEEFEKNRGKVAALNYLIEQYRSSYDIAIFSDVSAILSMDSFTRIAEQIENSPTSVVSGVYKLFNAGSADQEKYWQYQNQLRLAESDLGAVIGVPGAMFAVKTEKLSPLPENTINDDFVISMAAQDEINRAAIDPDINIVEMEQDQQQDDFKRRRRIAAGNLQQVFMLKNKLAPKMGWLAFNFFSGKVLRAFMPLCFLILYLTTGYLALQESVLAILALCGLAAIHILGLAKLASLIQIKLPVIDQVNYVVFSYFAGLMGMLGLITGKYSSPWQRLHADQVNEYKPVTICKRCFDIVGASIGLIFLSPVMLIAAIAIKLDSKGDVIYRQMRVGRMSDRFVELIWVYKLRSMVDNAEQASGAKWAEKNDPRVTRVGRILRKTRIDELPQLWNVLIGEMSLIGPRPERPSFYQTLEQEIPYFSQRTYLLKPGISGLAQVMNGYDETLEDARNKIAWDYAYSLSTTNLASWSRMEFEILLKTVKVVLTGKGQ